MVANFSLKVLIIDFYFTLSPTMQKRLAKEARAQEIQAKNAALGKKVKETPAPKVFKGRGEASFYRVTCKVCRLSVTGFVALYQCALSSFISFDISIKEFIHFWNLIWKSWQLWPISCGYQSHSYNGIKDSLVLVTNCRTMEKECRMMTSQICLAEVCLLLANLLSRE